MTQIHNILALDVGDRRIGVALANLEARLASPLLTLDRQEYDDILTPIQELIDQYDVSVVIVGLPRGMEGQETKQTAATRQFADTLKQAGLTVYLQDEAATSLAAEDELKATGKPYQKADIDKLAAALFLQDWLDSAEAAK